MMVAMMGVGGLRDLSYIYDMMRISPLVISNNVDEVMNMCDTSLTFLRLLFMVAAIGIDKLYDLGSIYALMRMSTSLSISIV